MSKLRWIVSATALVGITGLGAACSDGSTTTSSSGGGSSSSSSSGGSSSGGSSSSSSSGGSSSSSSGGGGQCNALTQQGTKLDVVGSKAAPPTATGGTVADGTYVLTGSKLYGASVPEGPINGVSSPATTVEIKGTTYNSLASRTSGDARTTSTLAVSGINATLTATCAFPLPDGGLGAAVQATYSATATGFTIYAVQGGITAEQVYTKK